MSSNDYPKYNPNGGINAMWAYFDALEHEERERRSYDDSHNSLHSVNGYYTITMTDDDDDEEEDIDRYEEAFQFLKRHSPNKPDEVIALEVLERLG